MAKNFLTPINLNKNEIQNAVVQNLATAPSSPVAGQLYFDSTGGDQTLYWFDGSQWIAAKAAAGATPAGSVSTSAVGDAGVVGISTNFAREDHKHGREAFAAAAAATSFGLAKVDGAAVTLARSDHHHGTPTHDTAAHSAVAISGLAAPTADVTLAGFKLTNLGTPLTGTDGANKTYVDNAVAGLSWKDSVRAASTANHGRSGLAAIDGVGPFAVGDRVLLKNQTNPQENGIYLAQSGTWVGFRASDADLAAEIEGMAVFVAEGTTLADTAWVCTANAPITVDTTPLPFVQFAGTGGSVPPARLINTTAPLAGGGALSTDLTLSVANATESATGVVELASTAEATAQSDTVRAVTPAGLADRVKTSLTLTGTAPIAIEGVHSAQSLAANRTISILSASTTVVGASRLATTAEATAQSLATVAVTPAGLADRVLQGRSIATTAPLTGGGDLSANRTLDISTFTQTVKGAVPPPVSAPSGKFLKDDGTWAAAGGGTVNKFSQATVGGTTSQVITHNLNTRDVIVNVYRTLTPWDTVECDVERTTVNTITLRFSVAPATNEYSVTVIG